MTFGAAAVLLAGGCRTVPSMTETPATLGRTGSTTAPHDQTPTPRAAGTAGGTRATASAAVTAAVRAEAVSVVRIVGVAPACSVEQQGSGFVISAEHVVTNAHVVQGLRGTSVQIGGVGRRYRARVVLFDPGVDLAVLDVPGLPARPLTVATDDPARGDAVVAAGFPLDGPFTLSAGRVLAVGTRSGPPVGSAPAQPRLVEELSTRVKPGNSGGPLLEPDGKVAGVVFARASRASAGFAIAPSAVLPVVRGALTATGTVSTGHC
jgi:S1-C subfamily serine protease